MGFLDLINFFLGSLLRLVLSFLNFLVFLFQLLLSILVFIWNVLVIVANFLFDGLVKVARFFRLIWDKVIKAPLLKLLELYNRLVAYLERTLGPIIRVLRRIVERLRRYYILYVLPILNVIQTLRRVLIIFRLLGFRFAQRLDRFLLELQTRINAVFATILGHLNQVLNILNLIIDPTFLIARTIFRNSWARAIRELLSLALDTRGRSLLPGPGLGSESLLVADARFAIRSDTYLREPIIADYHNRLTAFLREV